MPHPAIAFRHEITRAGRTYKVEGPEVALARIIRSQPEPSQEEPEPETPTRIPEVKRAAEGGPKTPPNYRAAPGARVPGTDPHRPTDTGENLLPPMLGAGPRVAAHRPGRQLALP
jgi:hypothetical protein